MNDMTYTRAVIQLCFAIPVVYTAVLMYPFINNRDTVIPLTFRTQFNKWGELRKLYETHQYPLSWPDIESVVWCPMGPETSSQCGCFKDYFETTYLPDLLDTNLTETDLREKHGQGAVMDCLRHRPSWRKETCGAFCRLHVSTPVILSCLYMLFFFSKLVMSDIAAVRIAAAYIPSILALIAIVMQLAVEKTGGIISSLSVISSFMESLYVSRSVTMEQVFWSYHRYLCGAMAVWAAVTHQARDIYNVGMYGVFGFTAGLLAYMVFLIKSGKPCRSNFHTCITVWLGICSVAGMFMIVIQQHWYSNSSEISSVVSVVCLVICLGQCLFQTPYDIAPVSLHVFLSMIILTISFSAVMIDTAR